MDRLVEDGGIRVDVSEYNRFARKSSAWMRYQRRAAGRGGEVASELHASSTLLVNLQLRSQGEDMRPQESGTRTPVAWVRATAGGAHGWGSSLWHSGYRYVMPDLPRG